MTASRSGPRICVLSEDLSRSDEGVKKFTLALADALRRQQHDVCVLATRGTPSGPGVRVAPASKSFLSWQLYGALARQRPELIVYVPSASTTLLACLRSQVLKRYQPSATVVMVGLQPRRHGRVAARLLRHAAPALMCVQAKSSQTYLERLGCSVGLLPSGVDLETFHGVDPERRRELRREYNLPLDRPIILHVGHLKTGRGIGALAQLAATGVAQVVLVTSSSTPPNQVLADQLREAGVTLLGAYQPQIQHLYQLADCYVFPVESAIDAIEVPLSVLEALACDLPVVATRFGGLPGLFENAQSPGLVFVDSTAELIAQANRMSGAPHRGTRALAMHYSWDAIARNLLAQAAPGGGTAW